MNILNRFFPSNVFDEVAFSMTDVFVHHSLTGTHLSWRPRSVRRIRLRASHSQRRTWWGAARRWRWWARVQSCHRTCPTWAPVHPHRCKPPHSRTWRWHAGRLVWVEKKKLKTRRFLTPKTFPWKTTSFLDIFFSSKENTILFFEKINGLLRKKIFFDFLVKTKNRHSARIWLLIQHTQTKCRRFCPTKGRKYLLRSGRTFGQTLSSYDDPHSWMRQ